MIYQLNSLFPLWDFNKLYIAYKIPVTCHILAKGLWNNWQVVAILAFVFGFCVTPTSPKQFAPLDM
jgi:hypothetical protein